MTSGERARLRAEANGIEATVRIGREGASEALAAQIADAFGKRELIKIKAALKSVPECPRALAEKLAAATESEIIEVIGGCIVLYKENPELRKEPKEKKPAKKGKPLSRVRAKKRAAERRAAEDKERKRDFYDGKRKYFANPSKRRSGHR